MNQKSNVLSDFKPAATNEWVSSLGALFHAYASGASSATELNADILNAVGAETPIGRRVALELNKYVELEARG